METQQAPEAPTSTAAPTARPAPREPRGSRAVWHVAAGLLIVAVIELIYVLVLIGAAQSGALFGALDAWTVASLVIGTGLFVTGIVFMLAPARRWLGLGLLIGAPVGTGFALIMIGAAVDAMLREI